ncbi:MAG: helix-turn-helix domain-containing protein [Clostridia bacterium]|nr:helix-turn-helix domain-containing protein [Clostridia bacterium]
MNGEVLRKERKRLRLTQADIGTRLGVSQQAVAKWERDIAEPCQSDLIKLANIYGVSVDYLLGIEKERTESGAVVLHDGVPHKALPLLSDVACGQPIYAEDNYDDYIVQNLEPNADFCVVAKGDSMINARIYDGDIVFVRKQPMVNNGEIAVVAIDDTATIKRVYYYEKEGRLVLMPENPLHAPLVYMHNELDHARILGKVISFFSRT